MTKLKELSKDELLQRIKDATDELIAREIEEVKPLKTEKRAARLGEKIVITNADVSCGFYENGDVFTVGGMNSTFTGVYARELHGDAPYISHREYEVLVEEEHDEYETCDYCSKKLDKLKSEDVYIEELDTVLCESCFDEATKSANQQRAVLIQRAREFVEEHTEFTGITAIEQNEGIRYAGGLIVRPKFIVNDEKRTVVALLFGADSKEVISKGIAKCMPGEVFNEWIGKAIALARALEIDIPEEFLDAVHPTEAVKGMVVYTASIIGNATVCDKTCTINRTVSVQTFNDLNFCEINGMPKIVNDTDAIYE